MTRKSNLLQGLLWTAPWWLGFLFFLALPMGFSLYISFCDYPLLQKPVFIGADNYRELARDPVFFKVIGNTFIYAALAIPAGTIVAVLLAVLLNRKVRGQAFYRACVFVPTVVPLVAVGVVWMWMLSPEAGLVNQVVRPVGQAVLPAVQALHDVSGEGRLTEPVLGVAQDLAEGPAWLDRPHWAMLALVLISLWLIGSPVVIYLAGLQEIPESLYEAAELDGASRIRRFWHVTLPGLSPVILFNVIVGIIVTWQIFALPYVIWRSRSGPEDATYFYTMYLFDNAFKYLKMGYASAMAWVQLLIILALTALVFWVGRKTVHYYGA
ncbi:MAG: sugar ABC transporter permease [Planctomycetota bacterium]